MNHVQIPRREDRTGVIYTCCVIFIFFMKKKEKGFSLTWCSLSALLRYAAAPVADHAGSQDRSGLDDNPRIHQHFRGEPGVHPAHGVDHGLVAHVHVRPNLHRVLVAWRKPKIGTKGEQKRVCACAASSRDMKGKDATTTQPNAMRPLLLCRRRRVTQLNHCTRLPHSQKPAATFIRTILANTQRCFTMARRHHKPCFLPTKNARDGTSFPVPFIPSRTAPGNRNSVPDTPPLTSDDCTVPHARVVDDPDVADHRRARGDEGRGHRKPPLLVQVHHRPVFQV